MCARIKWHVTRSYLVECNSTVYRHNCQHIWKANTSSSLSQYAVTRGDLNSDGEEEKRKIWETSSIDRQDVKNSAAEPLPSVIQGINDAAAEPLPCVSTHTLLHHF